MEELCDEMVMKEVLQDAVEVKVEVRVKVSVLVNVCRALKFKRRNQCMLLTLLSFVRVSCVTPLHEQALA
jgi:hypothetical protein